VSVVTKPQLRGQVFNVPNQLTAGRFVLSIVLFVLLPLDWYLSSLVVFVLAATTDWMDGYWARKYGQVTTLGRIFDPFVDKIIICGTFIFLVADPGSHIQAWMAVVVVGRELLVTALRGFLEGEGANFSAVMSGKLKMVLQCLAVGASMYWLSYETSGANPFGLERDWIRWTLDLSVWGAVGLTVYSGLEYVLRAIALFRRLGN